MTFRSRGVCRLFDNIFQSVRGGVIQRYGIDPFSHFNLLYTFSREAAMNGKCYRPHHAIISEIHRAQHSIRLVLFLSGKRRRASAAPFSAIRVQRLPMRSKSNAATSNHSLSKRLPIPSASKGLASGRIFPCLQPTAAAAGCPRRSTKRANET